uniref:Uncharacterized protein n=1 Tax=Wuchereria bancrofti TaxID=6293 RepID=A0AAF5RY43_WUCBA
MNFDKIDAWIDHKNNIKTMRVNNEVGKQTVVAKVVTNIVDLICKGCMPFDYFFDHSILIAQSTRNNELLESAFTVQSSSGSSDDEFDKILKSTGRQMSLQLEEENDDVDIATSTKTNLKLIEHEYDTMLAIEELKIHVEEDILLKHFGRIVNVVDRLGNIEILGLIQIPHLILTVIFDSECNVVGRPMYAILFSDVEEAISASQFTITAFTEKLRQQKATAWMVKECPDDMLAFSEQRYKAKHRSVSHRGESKKARYSSKYNRSKCRNNSRYNVTPQFRNGSEQYGGTQQSSFCSATVKKNGSRPF